MSENSEQDSKQEKEDHQFKMASYWAHYFLSNLNKKIGQHKEIQTKDLRQEHSHGYKP